MDFGLVVELAQTLNLVIVLCINVFAVTCAHAFRIVELRVCHWSNIVLVLQSIEEMEEISFLQFRITKCFREDRQSYRDEAKRVYKFCVYLSNS